MKSASCVLAAWLCLMASTEAFVFSPSTAARSRSAPRRLHAAEEAAEVEAGEVASGVEVAEEEEADAFADVEMVVSQSTGEWAGTDWPKQKPENEAIPPEARNWEVEGDRVDVWEDVPNPVTEEKWWDKFAASGEEIDASAQGFDWSEEWIEKNIKKQEALAAAKNDVVAATGGDDTVAATGGDDTVAATGGDDTVAATGGDDTVAATDGDIVAATGGGDAVAATGGDDTVAATGTK